MAFALVCGALVHRDGPGRFRADTPQPWLQVAGAEQWRGRWIRIRYRAGLFDDGVRPLIRFQQRDGGMRHIPMNGALPGVGDWIGPVPRDTVAVFISPRRDAGRFSFAIESIAPVSRLALVARGLARDSHLTMLALGARLIGAREEARYCLKFAALGTAMQDYDHWWKTRARTIDLADFDRPHADWNTAPAIRFVMGVPQSDAALARTLQSLRAQSYPNWTLHLAGGQAPFDDGRVQTLDCDAPLAGFAGDDLVTGLDAGDLLLPHGAAAVIDAFATGPAIAACYGDEDRQDTDGRLKSPRLKPDWSPIFQAGCGYVGRGVFVRAAALAGLGATHVADLRAVADRLHRLAPDQVGHVRHLVWRRTATSQDPVRTAVAPEMPDARATIVVPTRDRPALLRTCLDSVLRHTDYPLELILVDNGTSDAAALALLAGAEADPRVTVLRAPGPFNYAALCNRGAAAGTAPLLVFLNNDVVANDPSWLRLLARWALQPRIGVVGPKLLYPDGRVQHGGDVLGLGETAKQAYRGSADGQGYLGQLGHAREVGAVTGAVQVVARDKFLGVGGFDAVTFPVLFNDTDLCLKLAEKGLVNLFEPAARLTHLESASRGFSLRPFTRHAGEWANIHPRWLEAIRDDRFFHPALSLYRCAPALG